jgi:hypothetical protein
MAEKAKNIPPFVRFCAASVPMVFDNSLSYYECLCALTKKLQEIVDVVNVNAEQLQGLQDSFNELKAYVDNYFDNLDVQAEINAKLDEMAEGGQLAAIIAQFLAAAPVFGYDTISDMSNATNLANGCIARVLGNTTASAGDGAYYKVRTKEQGETADGFYKVAIGNTLIADRIITAKETDRTILIGDSYSLDRRPDIAITGWAVPLKDMLGLTGNDCYIIQDNGGGFTRSGSTGTFQQGLAALSVDDKSSIKRIVVCGGLNDCTNSKSTILNAISDFVNYCKLNYPNAKIYIGHIGNINDNSQADNQYTRWLCLKNSIAAYKDSIQYGCNYLNGVEFVMKNYDNYYDAGHPNQALCDILASNIYQALISGSTFVQYPEIEGISLIGDAVSGDKFNENSLNFREIFVNNCDILINHPEVYTELTFKSNTTVDSNQIIMGQIGLHYYRNVYPNFSLGNCLVTFVLSDDSLLECAATLEVYNYNNVNYLVLNKPDTTSLQAKALRIRQFEFTIAGSLC